MAGSRRALLGLLVLSIFINYVDRGNLSIAAPILSGELSLTTVSLGTLFSAFFWTYALFQLFGIAGWLADRFPAGLVLAAGFFVWSAATVLTGMVSGFAALFATRLLLGAGESVAYPCYSRILASDVPQESRGMANALIDAGSKLGPALGTLLGGVLLAVIGWRGLFIVFGAVSMIWLIPWFLWMPRTEAMMCRARATGPTTWQILRARSAWGAFFGHFCGNYFWFFLLTWLPTYLVRERGFSIQEMAQIGSIAYLTIATGTVVAGAISDRWIGAGGSPTRVRKTIVLAGLTFSTIILPVAFVNSRFACIALLLLACVSYGSYTSNHWAITQTLAGPLAAGRWTGIQNGIGNLSGIAASWLTGFAVARTGSFRVAFTLAAAVVFTGALMWGVVVGKVEEVKWEARNE